VARRVQRAARCLSGGNGTALDGASGGAGGAPDGASGGFAGCAERAAGFLTRGLRAAGNGATSGLPCTGHGLPYAPLLDRLRGWLGLYRLHGFYRLNRLHRRLSSGGSGRALALPGSGLRAGPSGQRCGCKHRAQKSDPHRFPPSIYGMWSKRCASRESAAFPQIQAGRPFRPDGELMDGPCIIF
jgi:hypothetical protein